MDLQGKTVASTFQFLLNQSGANPITLGNGGAVNWTRAGVVMITGNQEIIGAKDFAQRPRYNGDDLALLNEVVTELIAGNGLETEGGLIGNITLNVVPGDGLGADSNGVFVNSSVVRTTGNQTIAGTKTFSSTIQGSITSANAFTTSRNLWGRSFNGGADVTGSLTGVGDITFGTGTNKITATASTPSANRTYTIPDVSANASFVMTAGNQDIGGAKTFTSAPVLRATSNQLSIRTGTAGSAITITAPTITANRTYTIPDVGGAASFVMTTGNQDVGGTKNFTIRPTVNGTGVLLQGEAGGGGGGISTITAGSGLAGGGSSSTVTLDVGQGDGIIVSEDNIAVDSSVVRTTATNQTIAGIKTFQNQIVNAANANSHLGANSYIVAGQSNTIDLLSSNSVIVAGSNNNIDSANYSCVNAGFNNTIYSDYAFIGGGRQNIIRGGESVIVGGKNNETFFTDSEAACFIGGGQQNKVYGFAASIVGGYSNLCSGDTSFIGGGQFNEISGAEYSSIVGGRKAKIASSHTGAGVWADGQDRDHNSKGTHTLSLDFANGVHIPTGGLYVTGNTSFDTRPTVNGTGIVLQGESINSYVTGALSSDVSITNGTNWFAGPKVTLNSGIWMVNGFVTISHTGTISAGTTIARISGGADTFASTKFYSTSASAGSGVINFSLALSSIIPLNTETEVGISVYDLRLPNSSYGRVIAAKTISGDALGLGNTASQISAYKIG